MEATWGMDESDVFETTDTFDYAGETEASAAGPLGTYGFFTTF